MKNFEKFFKYLAIILAGVLAISIVGLFINLIFSLIDFPFYNHVYDYTNIEKLSINNIKDLNIDVSAANLVIKTGDSLKLDTNNKYIKVKSKEEKLIVEEKNHHFYQRDKAEIILYVPNDYIFNKVSIETRAGTINVEKLTANKLDLELGAGRVQLNSITSLNRAEISAGAGKTTIDDGNFTNLDLNASVGVTKINAKLIGNSSIDAGVGSLQINLLGNKDDYKIKVDKGIGSFKIDGQIPEDNSYYGNGINNINIIGGVGTIKVDFNKIKTNIYTKVYTVINKARYQENNKYYLTLQAQGGQVDTVVVEDKDNIIESGKKYEFTFSGFDTNNIRTIFLESELLNIKEDS